MKREKLTARKANIDRLYEESVQCPEFEVSFIKKLFKKMVKQRAESIDIYKKNNRSDLLEVEQNEYDIISSFLPKQLNEEDTKKICEETISSLGATSIKDMGKVMGELKKKYADEIDFSKAGALLKILLNK